MFPVTILLGTYNGAKFIDQQVRSLYDQDCGPVELVCSDDGSTDETLSMLRKWQARWQGSVTIQKGPGTGYAENFRSLLTRQEAQSDYVAFCDQDDIWDSDKLSAAIAWLEHTGSDHPALHCSRTRLIDQQGKPLGFSQTFALPPSFANALVQNIASGNTIVMNRAAYELVREASKRSNFVSHDWWSYLLVTGAGGQVNFSSDAKTCYRQHGNNILGENRTLANKLARLKGMLSGRLKGWTTQNLQGLKSCRDLLTDENYRLVDQFLELRAAPLPSRLRLLKQLGLHRQITGEQALLYVACAFDLL